MICIGILLYCFVNDFYPKWSGKAPNGVIMGDEYSQRPCSDFWADSGQLFVWLTKKTVKIVETPRGPNKHFVLEKSTSYGSSGQSA